MDVIVEDLCLKVRRYEAELRALDAAGRGGQDNPQYAEAERNVRLCRQWLHLLGAEATLERDLPVARPAVGWKPGTTHSKFAA